MNKPEEIMNALKDTLITTEQLNGQIHRNRVFEYATSAFPVVSLYMGNDEPQQDTRSINRIDSQLSVELHVYVAQKELHSIETQLNALREKLYNKLMADYTLGLGYVLNLIEEVAEKPQLTEGERPFGKQILNYIIHYRK